MRCQIPCQPHSPNFNKVETQTDDVYCAKGTTVGYVLCVGLCQSPSSLCIQVAFAWRPQRREVKDSGGQGLVPVLHQSETLVSTNRNCHSLHIACIYLMQLTGKVERAAGSGGSRHSILAVKGQLQRQRLSLHKKPHTKDKGQQVQVAPGDVSS